MNKRRGQGSGGRPPQDPAFGRRSRGRSCIGRPLRQDRLRFLQERGPQAYAGFEPLCPIRKCHRVFGMQGAGFGIHACDTASIMKSCLWYCLHHEVSSLATDAFVILVHKNCPDVRFRRLTDVGLRMCRGVALVSMTSRCKTSSSR